MMAPVASTDTAPSAGCPKRITTVARDESASVKPLELFFDLIFVLALTQCTALMASEPTWEGVAKGLLVLSILWWAWVGYAWLTSVIDPEEGAVRLAIFGAMAALGIVTLAVPEAFDEDALIFALAYGAVRIAQIVLFFLASRGEANLRASVTGLGISTAISIAILAGASFTDGALQGGLWALAIVIDFGGPALFGLEGWKLSPAHFAERHGLVIIIALGESIVAIGVGAEELQLDTGLILAAAIGISIAAAQWWQYFDIVALVAERRLTRAAPGRERNAIARDSYSYLHLPMVAGIVLVALGLKKTVGHTDEALKLVPAVALLGGGAMYLAAHVAFRWRNVHRFSTQRVVVAVLLVALIPVALEIPSLAIVALMSAVMWALIVYETHRFGELRTKMRAELSHH